MRFLFLLFTLFMINSVQPAQAQKEDPLLALPDGQVVLNISATVREEVEQDMLVASLSYKVIDASNRVVQNDINTKMAKVLDTAKKVDSVKVSTGSYNVYEYTEPRTKERKWRGQQSVTLKSMKSDDLLELVKELQELGLVTSGLNYVLAPKTAVKIQDNLMEDALKELQTRANRAANALGKSTADLRDVRVQGQNIPYSGNRFARSMAIESVAEDVAAPVAAAGETTITLTVNARAILKP